MKMIFKIEEYLPDTKQVVIRYCRQNAPKPISEYPAKAVSTENYDTSFAVSYTHLTLPTKA